MSPEGPKPMTTADVFGGKKVVLFAVPGAFTPTCHNTHLPGFIQMAGEMKSKGIDTIACVSVNDIFVLTAWAKQTGAEGKILFLADGAADFAKKVGLDLDLTARGMGVRSRRYSMVVEDGVVNSLNLEENPVVDKTSAATICGML
jgi:peroxiredoxin